MKQNGKLHKKCVKRKEIEDSSSSSSSSVALTKSKTILKMKNILNSMNDTILLVKDRFVNNNIVKELNGATVIERVIERSKKVDNCDYIILCTSEKNQDLPLVQTALKNNIFYFNVIFLF